MCNYIHHIVVIAAIYVFDNIFYQSQPLPSATTFYFLDMYMVK